MGGMSGGLRCQKAHPDALAFHAAVVELACGFFGNAAVHRNIGRVLVDVDLADLVLGVAAVAGERGIAAEAARKLSSGRVKGKSVKVRLLEL